MTDIEWMKRGSAADRRPPVDLKTDRLHPARVYDYLLGGKDNFAADRAAGEQPLRANPTGRVTCRENRAFMRRAVQYLATEAGISQFLDIGTGLPTSPNVHEVAQAIIPDARIVYADNDPIVLTHARALLASGPQGKTAYVDADLRDTEGILSSAEVRETLDFSRPVGLLLIAIMHFIPDQDGPYDIASRLLAALPSGSYLALSHLTGDFNPQRVGWRGQGLLQLRHGDEGSITAGGRAFLHRPRPDRAWRPVAAALAASRDGELETLQDDATVSCYGGLARKL